MPIINPIIKTVGGGSEVELTIQVSGVIGRNNTLTIDGNSITSGTPRPGTTYSYLVTSVDSHTISATGGSPTRILDINNVVLASGSSSASYTFNPQSISYFNVVYGDV